jgi:tRNA 2-thiocytidine biosynthesis protein TtcA
MICDGDRIAVGVSGGKDSLTLLYALKRLQSFYPKPFDLEAITLTMGFGDFDTGPIQAFCDKIGVNLTVEDTLIGKIVFEERKEKNPCSLCANLRRGALHNKAIQLGCNKVALGHNKDDVIETFLLSLFYEGRLHTFSPVTYLDRKKLFVIRPLIYAEEKEIRDFVKKESLVTVKNPCFMNGSTKRQYIKNLLYWMSKEKRDLKSNLFGAIKRSNIDGW